MGLRLGLIAVALVALVGCTGSAGDRSSSATEAASGADAGSGALAAQLAKGPAAGRQLADDRQIVRTGSLTVRVGDAPDAARRATAVAARAGGYVSGQDAQLEGDREVAVTVRVPADRFDAVMDDLAGLGDVQARTVSAEEVTDQVVDLQGRLASAQASAERLRQLLGRAENVQNIATLEDHLSQRESDIEQITGQLEVLTDQVRLSTVSATFSERAAPAVADGLPGPLQALRAGAVALANVALAAVAVVAFLVPFAPLAALGWWLVRRWRRRRAAAAGPSLPPPPPDTPLGVGPTSP